MTNEDLACELAAWVERREGAIDTLVAMDFDETTALLKSAAARLRELESKVKRLEAHNRFLAGRTGSPDDLSEALHTIADAYEAREGAGANTLVLRGAAGRIRGADAMGAAVATLVFEWDADDEDDDTRVHDAAVALRTAAADIIKSRDAEIGRLRAALVNIATLPPLRAGEASRIAERALEPAGGR